jgi:steroid delta-isomerase-like uncharacterized protein
MELIFRFQKLSPILNSNIFNMIKIFVIASLFLLPLQACNDKDGLNETEEVNKETVISFINTIWNNKELSKLEIYVADQFIRRVNNVEIAAGKKELSANVQVSFTGFPDLTLSIDEIVPYDDLVIMNWTILGTNTGVFGEFPPTGKKIKIGGISHIKFDNEGKIIYDDVFYNELSLLQQLGYTLMPPTLE